MNLKTILLLALGVSFLGGCGFQLPNQSQLQDTFKNINVSGDYHDPFYKKVVHNLEISGIKINPQFSSDYKAQESIPTLVIPSPTVSTPIASINANAETLEYQIIVTTNTTLKVPNHRPIMMRNTLTRTLLNKPGLSLATSNEKNIILDETLDELASQLVTRLSYLGRQSDPDAIKLTPASLVIADGEDPKQKEKTLREVASDMTLLEALQYSNSVEDSLGRKTNIDDLNNANKILDVTKYQLPKTKPIPTSEAHQKLNSDEFDINKR